MARYLLRHGGLSEDRYERLKGLPGAQVERLLRGAVHSDRERWSDPSTAGFWSRWLLWSHPSLRAALRFLKERWGIRVILRGGAGEEGGGPLGTAAVL